MAHGTEPSSSSQNSPEPRGLLSILALAFLFLWPFSRLRSQRAKKYIDTIRDSDKAECQYKYPPPHININAELHTPEHIERQRTENEKRNYRLQAWLVVGTWLAFIAAAIYAGITFRIWHEMQKQNNMMLSISARPWVFVKAPDSIDIEIGKPLTAKIEVFNYSKSTPGMVRASIHIEAGKNVIENFRCRLLPPHNETDFLAPDDGINKKILIRPYEGTTAFPVDSSNQILTKQVYDGIKNGTMDVAVFGRIFYTDLGAPTGDQHRSIFCFHLLKDGSVSACTNKKGAYTNWMEPD